MPRLIVGLSGSTGPHYGVRLLEVLREQRPDVETHVILSNAARMTISYEMGRDPDSVAALAHTLHDERNIDRRRPYLYVKITEGNRVRRQRPRHDYQRTDQHQPRAEPFHGP